MRTLYRWWSILAALALAGPAAAAPVAVNATLEIHFRNPSLPMLSVGGAGTVSVAGSTLRIPAGLLGLDSSRVVPVTATTVIDSMTLFRLSNLTGTFSVGGITSQAPDEVCTPSGPPAWDACNRGGGFGGLMGLTGLIQFNVDRGSFNPGIIVIPMDLGELRVGRGGSTNDPFLAGAAGWSTGPGVIFDGRDGQVVSPAAGEGLQLVTPTYVSIGGGSFAAHAATLSLSGVTLPVPEASGLPWVVAGLAGLVWLRESA